MSSFLKENYGMHTGLLEGELCTRGGRLYYGLLKPKKQV